MRNQFIRNLTVLKLRILVRCEDFMSSEKKTTKGQMLSTYRRPARFTGSGEGSRLAHSFILREESDGGRGHCLPASKQLKQPI